MTRERPKPAARDPRSEVDAIAQIGRVLTSTLDTREVLARVMEQVRLLVGPSAWSLLLVDEETGGLRFEIAVGEGAEGLVGSALAPGQGIAGWVADHGEALLVPRVCDDPRWSDEVDGKTGRSTASILAVPMRIQNQVLGVIELIGQCDQGAFDEEDLRVLSYLADYAAIGLFNARNYERVQAETLVDEHTSLHNARYLFKAVEVEFERARRYLHPFSLLFLDLDKFKSVNDNHGHLAGSEVLREVGEVLAHLARGSDLPCRYGGDEFVVVLPETGRDGAILFAERVRDAMHDRVFLARRGLDLTVTVSVGVATYPDDASTVEGLMRCSDVAMYAAKAAGRNSVVAAGHLPDEAFATPMGMGD